MITEILFIVWNKC